MSDVKTLDQILYEAYSNKVKELFKFEDDIVIRWIDLPQELRDAWKAAEKAVLDWMDEEDARKNLFRGFFKE